MMNNQNQFSLRGIEAARKLNNYKVIGGDVNNGKCIVFFSGNGLYFPNTENELKDVITQEKYEWGNLYPRNYEKIIFIRDVYKQWYIEGISNELNSIDKVKMFIDREIKNYITTFVGSSAGGYAAVLFGNLCGADLIISLSGQFDLTEEKKRTDANQILCESADERYVDVSGLVNKNVVYFNPCFSLRDDFQRQLARKNKNIIVIEIKSSSHGVPFYPFALRKLLNLDLKDYLNLSARKHNMIIFSLRYCTKKDFLTWGYNQAKKVGGRIRKNVKKRKDKG